MGRSSAAFWRFPLVFGVVYYWVRCVRGRLLCGLDCLIWPARSSASGITVLFITRGSHFSPLSKWASCTRLGSSCYVFVCVFIRGLQCNYSACLEKHLYYYCSYFGIRDLNKLVTWIIKLCCVYRPILFMLWTWMIPEIMQLFEISFHNYSLVNEKLLKNNFPQAFALTLPFKSLKLVRF